MSVDLREVLDEEMDIETEELISDKVLNRMYNKAVHWYRKYRLFPRTNTYNYSIESGDYVPDILMDQVVTLDGKTDKLKIPEGTQTGKTFSLKGKGIPDINSKRKGDIVISVVVETPTNLTAEQKKLLSDFAKTLGEGDAAGGKRESFFKRLFK